MADRHKSKPISFRPPEGDRLWLASFAAETGRPLRAVLAAALAEYRANHGGVSANGGATTDSGDSTPRGSSTRGKPRTARKPRTGPEPATALPSALPDVPLTVASALPKPRRCSHPGKRSVGGWCPDCDHLIKPGGIWA